jgi:hypothetical protein
MKETIILAAIILSSSVAVGTISSLIVLEYREPLVVKEKEFLINDHYYNYSNTTVIIEKEYVPTYIQGSSFYVIDRSEQCKNKKLNTMEEHYLFGKSMLPTISDKEKLLVIPYDRRKPLVSGDIVVFKNGETVIHRVVGVYEEWGYVITKGDNNLYEDEPTKLENIYKVVCGVIRN